MVDDKIVLTVSELSICFPELQNFVAVNKLSFNLCKGKNLAIVGESGSGKSLLALSIIGLQPSNALLKGTINFDGKNLCGQSISLKTWQQIRGKEIGMIFQEPMSALNPVQTVGQQLKESILTHQKISESTAEKKCLEWIKKVKIANPEKIYNRYPHQLSGGQKQRIMIAMAMCQEPKILLADEPTTALDATVQLEIVQLMKSLQSEFGTAMVFITHDLSLAAEIADEILVMQSGHLVEYGAAKVVFESPKEIYTKALIACRPQLSNKGKKLMTINDFTAKPDGVSVTNHNKKNIGDEILNVRNLKVRYADGKNFLGKTTHYFQAVNDVSFFIGKGETLGLVGESGCGKSTIGKALMGLAPIQSGNIFLKQKEIKVKRRTDWGVIRKDIQLIFQDPYASLNPRHNIMDIITEPLKIHQNKKDPYKEAIQLLEMVQLPQNALYKYPHQFSGGQRQRIGIARALALKPKILICDESVSALDVSVQAQILNLLQSLQAEFGLAYLFISHDLSVVHYMADKIIVMRKGEIVESGDANQIITNPQSLYTKTLVNAMPKNSY